MSHPDSEIDDIIWTAIGTNGTKGDMMCYVIHAPVGAKYLALAKSRIENDPQGDLFPAKYPEAIARIRELAETAHPAATFHMGKIHVMGIAMQPDPVQGASWYEKAVALGEPRAFANLGWLYESGTGVGKDTKKAVELLSVGADKGVLSARAALGMMQIKGEEFDKDVDAGIAKLESAYEDGYVNAGNVLSDLYYEGRDVPQDTDKSHAWLERIANDGDERTMAILGYRLVSGSHGKQDIEAGMAWLKKAMDHRFGPAWIWLGNLYKKGIGVEEDFNRAVGIYRDGMEAGFPECEIALNMALAEKGLVLSSRNGKPS